MKFVRYAIVPFGLMMNISTVSLAAPPVAFGTTNSATSPCPTNFSCEMNGADKDMMQRILWSSSGQRYVQTIVDSTGSDKTHLISESFINASNTATQGISAKQTVYTPGADSLLTTATINTGWASSAGTPSIKIEQIQRSSYKGVGYASSYLFEGNLDKSGKQTGYYLDIRQEVSNSTAISSIGKSSGTDLHVFVTRKAGGDRVTAGSASLPAAAQGMMGSGGSAGGSVTWKNGNEVQVIWIGQTCDGCQNGGGMTGGMGGGGMGMMMGGSSFSFQSYDNLSDGTAAINSRNFSTSPINWVSVFGAAPKMGSTISTATPSAASTLKPIASTAIASSSSILSGTAPPTNPVINQTVTGYSDITKIATTSYDKNAVGDTIKTTNTVENNLVVKHTRGSTATSTVRVNGLPSTTGTYSTTETVTATTSTLNAGTGNQINNPGSGTTTGGMGGMTSTTGGTTTTTTGSTGGTTGGTTTTSGTTTTTTTTTTTRGM